MSEEAKPKSKAKGLSTTFREDEVRLANQMFSQLLMGGNPSTLTSNPAFKTLVRKFQGLRAKADRVGSGR